MCLDAGRYNAVSQLKVFSMSFAGSVRRNILLLGIFFLLPGCGEDESSTKNNEPVIRGLKTVLVKDEERIAVRKYPGILQPSSISTLSFEIAGKLETIQLDVGQPVKKGDVLAKIDPKTLLLKLDSAKSVFEQAKLAAQIAGDDYKRKAALLKKGVIAQAAADKSRNEAQSAKANMIQAEKAMETAQEDLGKTELKVPFDGVINTVEAKSFANVSPGGAIATIYSIEGFEASFTVNYDVVNKLVVGKKAVVRLADDPTIKLDAQVSELGAKADTVSSFPVVVKLNNTSPNLKAGMAIEIALSFAVENGKGFLLPLSVLALEGDDKESKNHLKDDTALVYVFDSASSTVKRREIKIGGIRENALIVVDGLKLGENVASAGVSFLRDGQKVKLLPSVVGE